MIDELIERLEAATGPCRELDAAIAVAVHGGEIVWKTANYTMESYPARRHASANHVGGFCNDHVPLYSASIDAALTLVGDREWPNDPFTLLCAAMLLCKSGKTADLPRFIVIAALRAGDA